MFTDAERDEASWAKVMTQPKAQSALEEALRLLEDIENWDSEEIETTLRGMLADLELSARKGLQPIRVAVSGSTVSPPLFESLAVLGRDNTLERIRRAVAEL